MTKALIIVDVQNDFCEGGSLAVEGGADLAARIARYLEAADHDLVVATRDMHTDRTTDHFAAGGHEPDFSTRWPVHCMTGTRGAEFHPNVADAIGAHDVIEIHKGQETAAYSGFEGTTVDTGQPLAELLDDTGVDQIDICGLATDHCVRATALDALAWAATRRAPTPVRVFTDLVAAVDPAEAGPAAIAELQSEGATIADSGLS